MILELDSISLRKKECQTRIEELYQEIALKESRVSGIELSLQESKKIASETEAEAENKAMEIMADAEALAASCKSQIWLAEQEIAALNEELQPPEIHDENVVQHIDEDDEQYPNYLDNQVQQDPHYLPISSAYSVSEDLGISSQPVYKPGHPSAVYDMKLVSFVNARHFVTFGGKDGPIHAHSWQAQIEVEVPAEKGEVMGFAKISSAITSALAPYENTVLNYVPPFNIIQPTTENIAMYFYNCVEDALLKLGLGLSMISLWETPTRGIQVNIRNVDFDGILQQAKDAESSAQELAAMQEMAEVADKAFKDRISGMFDLVKVKRPLRVSNEWAQGPIRPPYSFRKYAIAFLIICTAAFLVYYNILFPSFEQRFPWGSDSWGHLYKADYLYHEILKGNYYPQFTEYWYNGNQPFRYYAPLPYYVLALLDAICGDIFTAGNLYIFICALLGGLSWLLLARWMGLWPAVLSGVIWVLWQDNLRVSLSEGNIPRVLATAFLPLLFAVFLRTLGKEKSITTIILTVVLIHAVVLSHAMIGAVYCVGLFIFIFFLWIFGGCRLQDSVLGVVLLVIGIASSAWWLLPSLTGGITGIDADAVKEALQFIPAHISLNPFYRFQYMENFYWGISILAALAATIITWRSKPAWAKSLAICGIILVIITFPLLKGIFIIIPLSHLLWPLRFSSFAILAILAAALTYNTEEYRQPILKSSRITGIILLVLFTTLLVDSWFSARLLVHTSSNRYDVLQSAQALTKETVWRVATIDLSQLGSAPSYIFSESSGMEQVFGWAWQGAVTSRNVMLLNTGLEMQYYPFLFRSCVDLGATDLVVKDDVVEKPDEFWKNAKLAGYKYQQSFQGLSLWHSVDQPYLVIKEPECLVIGRYAGTIALQFPEVEMGFSNEIDQYSIQQLKKYSKIILTGATWSSKAKTERLIKGYLDSGGDLIVELSGMPENILAKQPEFLGVYGEAIAMRGQLVINGSDKTYELEPVPVDIKSWKAYVPMGLDKTDLAFTYYGNEAPVYGYKLVNGKKVWYLGANLAYHCLITGDKVALQILKDTLGLDTSYPNPRLVPLQKYQATESGYIMEYQADNSIDAIVPVSAIDGLQAKLDGAVIPLGKYENLLRLKLPEGTHRIEIELAKTPVYSWGMWISLFSLGLLIAFIFYITKRNESRS